MTNTTTTATKPYGGLSGGLTPFILTLHKIKFNLQLI